MIQILSGPTFKLDETVYIQSKCELMRIRIQKIAEIREYLFCLHINWAPDNKCMCLKIKKR